MVKINNAGEKIAKVTGIVTQIIGNRILFKATTAANFDAQTDNTELSRRNGTKINFEEILVGDKVEVLGKLWSDNSINAITVKNLSLYPHNSTFVGKITGINLTEQEFTIQNKSKGEQIVKTTKDTNFSKLNTPCRLQDLELGWTATIKGTWERNPKTVTASNVKTSVRFLNIEITGNIVSKDIDNNITVVANNVIYGVELSKSKVTDKANKKTSPELLRVGGEAKVYGKHIPEGVKIYASRIKILN